jgi:hypothetical protein
VKDECLSKLILLGERSLRRALNECVEHYHAERNHQGKGNVILFPDDTDIRSEPVIARPKVQCQNSDFAHCDREIEEVADAALLPVIPTLVLRQARSTWAGQVFYRRSIFLAHTGFSCGRLGAGNEAVKRATVAPG